MRAGTYAQAHISGGILAGRAHARPPAYGNDICTTLDMVKVECHIEGTNLHAYVVVWQVVAKVNTVG